MAPKKKAGNLGDNVEPGTEENAEKVDFLTNKVQALQYQIVWEQERADRSKLEEDNLRK